VDALPPGDAPGDDDAPPPGGGGGVGDEGGGGEGGGGGNNALVDETMARLVAAIHTQANADMQSTVQTLSLSLRNLREAGVESNVQLALVNSQLEASGVGLTTAQAEVARVTNLNLQIYINLYIYI